MLSKDRLLADLATNLLQGAQLSRCFSQLSCSAGVFKLAGLVGHGMLGMLLGFKRSSFTQITRAQCCISKHCHLVRLDFNEATGDVEYIFLTALLTQLDRAWFQFRQKRSVTRVDTQVTQATCHGDELDQAGKDLFLGTYDVTMNSHSHLDYLLKGSARNLQALGFLDGFFDGADHVESLLRQRVIFTRQDTLEATDSVFQRNVLTRCTGEDFGNEERLGQEALDLTRTGYGLLIFFRQLVHTQDRDDVLQFLVALQSLLYATSHIVVFLTDNQRIQLTRGGIQRVDRRVDTQLRDLTRQYNS